MPIISAGDEPTLIDASRLEDGSGKMVERSLFVEEEARGLRLDHFLKSKIPRLSRTKLQAIIKTQLIRKSGAPMKAHSPVTPGEVFVIRREAQPEPPCLRAFTVLYEDDESLVLNKPAGLPVHSSAKFYFNTLTRVLAETYPGEYRQICHRLDRETSGALVVAKSKAVAVPIKQQFADKVVKKEYLAIVHGQPSWDTCLIDRPLALAGREISKLDIRMAVKPDGPPSQTDVIVERRYQGFTLLRCMPRTGRQHQIRAHLADAGFPIVGDKLYTHGDDAFIAYCRDGLTEELLAKFTLPRHALHAAEIAYINPTTGHAIEVGCPLPIDLSDFLANQKDC